MASWIWEHRDRFLLELTGAEQAVAEALAVPPSERQGRPVVIHETSDNCGGGGTGDATYLIAAMLKLGPFERGEACFGFIVDPEAVTLAEAVGVGGILPELRLGGKMDSSGMHGAPLELKNVEVLGVSDGKFTLSAFKPGWREDLGPMAHLCVDGLEILVSTLRNQTFCPAVFAKHGIDVNTCVLTILPSSRAALLTYRCLIVIYMCSDLLVACYLRTGIEWSDSKAPVTSVLGSGRYDLTSRSQLVAHVKLIA